MSFKFYFYLIGFTFQLEKLNKISSIVNSFNEIPNSFCSFYLIILLDFTIVNLLRYTLSSSEFFRLLSISYS